jgi:hypothetical protein
MKLRKTLLRDCACYALEQRGFSVKVEPGKGIVPGARLLAVKGPDCRRVAVRTSRDREVGLMRDVDGSWLTIPKVHEVVVVVPSVDDQDTAEVFGFERDTILAAFDEALTARKRVDPFLSKKAPVFIALDDTLIKRAGVVVSGLQRKAEWRAEVPLASVPSRTRPAPETLSFVQRVKEDFARLNGVDVSKVVVEFRIIA